LTGDDSDATPSGSEGLSLFDTFTLSEFPWDYSYKYRLQVQEREVYDNGAWELEWRAEMWRGTTTSIGDSDWITESDLDDEGIDVPSLSSSKILTALSKGEDGSLNTDIVATSYIVY
jgi:hypothetical protein